MAYRAAKAVVALLAVAPLASAHSWVEFIKRINSDGSFTGNTGYPLPYVKRGAPGYSDEALLNKILDTKSNPSVCKQGNFKYSDDFPRLAAAGGDYVAMMYEENGHVTQPLITKRPYRSGNVYVYGTLKETASTGINDVLYSWNAQGTGGDKRGQLLATHFYDDGQCYQNLGGVEPDPVSKIYSTRREKYGADAINCQSAFRLPKDLPEKGIYNVMWVWDWPLITGDNTNVTEIYTSCAEIELGPRKGASSQKMDFSPQHNVTNGAIQSQIHTLIEAVTLGQGTNSPPAPTATAGNTAPTSATVTATGGATTTATDSASATTGPATVTVTVTADPITTTVFQTVTFGSPQTPTSSVPGSSTDSATAFPTEQASLAPTSTPTEFLPGFPTDFPTVFPTTHSPSTRSQSASQQQSTFQTSVRSSSSSSSSSLASSTGFPVLTKSSTLSTTLSPITSDSSLLPGSPSATPVSSGTRSSSASSSALETTSSSLEVLSSSSSSSSASASTTSSDRDVLPGFPTRSSSSTAANPTSSSVEQFPTPGFPTKGSSTSTIATASLPASETRSAQLPTTFSTLVRPASSSSVPAVTQSRSSSTTSEAASSTSSAALESSSVAVAPSTKSNASSSSSTQVATSDAASQPVVTPRPTTSTSLSRPASAPTSFVPVTSIEGFL